MTWQEKCGKKLVSPQEAVKAVQDGDFVVFPLGAGGEPAALGFALAERAQELKDVTVFHAVANAPYAWLRGECFQVRCSYFGPLDRRFGQERKVDYVPWSYGTLTRQAEYGRWGAYTKPDVFLVKVSPPDEDGWCSFGHSVWYSPTSARNARTIIAEVDPSFIRPCGEDARIHISQIDYLVEGKPLDLSRVQFPPVPEDEALADPRDAWFAVRSAVERRPPQRPVEELEVELVGLSAESGKQASLFEGGRARLRRQVAEAVRQLQAQHGRALIGKVVEVEPWSRIPERRAGLLEFEP